MAWTPNAKLTVPDDNATIWRYMDLPKFLSLIEEKALYFAAPAQLEDKWEARVHGADNKALVDAFGVEQASTLKAGSDRVFSASAINCWYHGEGESIAMWALYTQPTYGVAIRSSVGRLCVFGKAALSKIPA
jgi:hypothetical protein